MMMMSQIQPGLMSSTGGNRHERRDCDDYAGARGSYSEKQWGCCEPIQWLDNEDRVLRRATHCRTAKTDAPITVQCVHAEVQQRAEDCHRGQHEVIGTGHR